MFLIKLFEKVVNSFDFCFIVWYDCCEVDMGFFGKMMSVIGFQSTEEKPKRKEKNPIAKGSYDLRKQEKVEKADNLDGIKIFYPEEIAEVKKIYEFFKNGDPVIINFEYADEIERDKIKAYFYGIADASKVKFLSINGEKMYILLPEGVEIED